MTVREFAGIGINIVTSIATGGNANNSVFSNCSTQQNRIHGFYVQGSDANNIAFNNCEAVSNGGTGFSDQSFLGNSYTKFHAASNGSPELPFQAGLVIYGGHTYACKLDSTINVLPTNTTAWQDLGTLWATGYPFVLAYSASKVYYVAAAVDIEGSNIVSGQNQSTSLIGCYVESDQPPGYVGANAVIIGGNLAAATFRAGNTPARLAGGNFALTTYNNFWSGNPGNFGTRRTYQSPNGFVVTVASGNEMMVGYDTTRKALDIVDPAAANGTGKFKIASAATTSAQLGRSNLAYAVPLFSHGAMFATPEDRAQYQNIDFARSKPTNSNSDYGDIVFATHRLYLDHKPEVVLYKFIEKSAGAVKQWTAVEGYVEYSFTSTDASSYQVCMDYYPTKAIKYDIQILCSDAAGNYWNETRSILVGIAATITLIKDNTLVGTSFKDAALSTCSFTPTISGASFEMYVAGKAATTITWKIHIKRIVI